MYPIQTSKELIGTLAAHFALELNITDGQGIEPMPLRHLILNQIWNKPNGQKNEVHDPEQSYISEGKGPRPKWRMLLLRRYSAFP